MKCTACDGRSDDCPDCGGRGSIRITECPSKMMDRTIIRFVELAGYAEKGNLPVAGGTLNQCESFMDACRRFWGEEDYWKGKLKIT